MCDADCVYFNALILRTLYFAWRRRGGSKLFSHLQENAVASLESIATTHWKPRVDVIHRHVELLQVHMQVLLPPTPPERVAFLVGRLYVRLRNLNARFLFSGTFADTSQQICLVTMFFSFAISPEYSDSDSLSLYL